ncbi:hypothetical protein IWW42_003873 [Coemansia sp. RSA 1085]|nr:hypothetical protein IWW42_003873 [Coemansia sp. RSA 1085]
MFISIESVIHQAISDASYDLRRLSLEIHDNPETALEEKWACRYLTEYLNGEGYKVEQGVGGLETAFVASYTSPSGNSGLNVGFCSEYDALPLIGHGCGHNLIAISGVAMFLALSKVMDTCGVPGTVKLFGTPAEEAKGGKIIMHKQGVFEGIDLLMMVHPSAAFCGNWHSQASLSMTVEYFGKSAHAAMSPWNGINAGSAATIALQTIGVLREQLKPDWRAHGIIADGGQVANVIPDYSRIEYTIRTGWSEELDTLRTRILRIFEAAALATGCTHKVKEEHAYLDNLANPVLAEMYDDIMSAKYQKQPDCNVGGSTDFGNLSHSFITLHGMYDLAGTGVPNHSKEFTKGARTKEAHERTLFAAETIARIAARSASLQSLSPSKGIEMMRDFSTYPQFIEAFQKSSQSAKVAFETILQPIEDTWLHSVKPAKGKPAAADMSYKQHNPDTQKTQDRVRLSTLLLKMLYVVIMSFPQEMSEIFSKKAHASRLLMLVKFSEIPINLRLIMVSLISRWSKILGSNPKRKCYLPTIVDSFYYDTGHAPRKEFLLQLPAGVQLQPGWKYPSLNSAANEAEYLYIPAEAIARSSAESSAADRQAPTDRTNQAPQSQPTQNMQQQKLQRRPPQHQPAQPIPQQQQSTSNLPQQQKRQPASQPRINTEPPSSNVGSVKPNNSLDFERMKACAQELRSLSTMLIENLSMMETDEDPQTNAVIQDMMQRINSSYATVHNYSKVLNAEYEAANTKLQLAADGAKQSMAAYNTTIQNHKQWSSNKNDQNALLLSPISTPFTSPVKKADDIDLASASISAFAESSRQAMARNNMATPPSMSSQQESTSSTASAPPQSAMLERVSTKVRGKMRDVS